jgi:hypothetical protein
MHHHLPQTLVGKARCLLLHLLKSSRNEIEIGIQDATRITTAAPPCKQILQFFFLQVLF